LVQGLRHGVPDKSDQGRVVDIDWQGSKGTAPAFKRDRGRFYAGRVKVKLMPIQIGDILGDYQITGVLGRGGMGRVFRVRSLVTDREEAMKVVLPGLADDSDLADRFLREIKVHASLQHPNIATLHTALRIEDRLI